MIRRLLPPRAKRELQEERHPEHPRTSVSPRVELELADQCVHAAAADEERCHFDDSAHPKPPNPKEEGVTSLDGGRLVDIQGDTPTLESAFGFLKTDPGADEISSFSDLAGAEAGLGSVESEILGVDVDKQNSVEKILKF